MQSSGRPATTANIIALDLRLDTQIWALAGLPPNTLIPPQDGLLAAHLFERLITGYRQNGESPARSVQGALARLRTEEGDKTALLTLALLVDMANGMRASQARYRQPTQSLEQQALWGQLLAVDDDGEQENTGPSVWWNRVSGDIDAPLLVRELDRLRAASHLTPESDPRLSFDTPTLQTLLADLLRLPDGSDPVTWLRYERGFQCARVVLAHLVNHTLPNVSAILPNALGEVHGSPLGWRYRRWIKVNPSFIVRPERFYQTSAGFTLSLRVIFRAQAPETAPVQHDDTSPQDTLIWEGFPVATDDRGHRYLLQMTDCQIARKVGRAAVWDERLTLVGWPNPEGADELLFEADPAALAAYYTPSFGGELVPRPTPTLGRFEVRVPLKA